MTSILQATSLIFALLALSSCGGNSSANSTPTGQPGGAASHAYVSNYDNGLGQTLTGYAVASTNGNLLPFDLSAIKVPTGPTSLATASQGKYIYVGSQSGLISAFTIDSVAGGLTQIGGSPYGAGKQVSFLAVDSSSQYLFSVDTASNTVWPFTIAATSGVLTPVPSSDKVPSYGVTPGPPISATVDPMVKNLYVAMGAAGTEVFHINSGALVDAGTVAPPSGTKSEFVAIERTGRFAYIADGTGSVAAYSIDQSTGLLTWLATTALSSGDLPTSLALAPSGKYLYAANQGANTVSQLALQSDGTLVSLGADVPAGGNPSAMAIDSAATFLYVVNQGSNTVSIYRISALNGTLTVQAPADTGPSPSSIVTIP